MFFHFPNSFINFDQSGRQYAGARYTGLAGILEQSDDRRLLLQTLVEFVREPCTGVVDPQFAVLTLDTSLAAITGAGNICVSSAILPAPVLTLDTSLAAITGAGSIALDTQILLLWWHGEAKKYYNLVLPELHDSLESAQVRLQSLARTIVNTIQ